MDVGGRGGGTEGVSLMADSEVVLWMWGGGGGGLKVSHYWQTVKWYYGCGGEGGGTEGVSLLADSEVVSWLWGGGGLEVSHY